MTNPETPATLRVSVIIPTYNRAGYLQEALTSVFAQTLPPWEVIVIDDGSTDNTEEVVETYGSGVRYFRQENQGVSVARNHGLSVARGDVIAWLDADDLWTPDFLATVVPLLTADSEVDGFYTGCAYIDAHGNLLPQTDHKTVPASELFSSLADGNFITTPSLVVRKRCFDQVGDFDARLRICEDYDMWLRLASNFTLVGQPTSLVKIRIHDNNTVRDTEAFCRFRLMVAEKHFGAPEGEPSTWAEDKRRTYGLAYREVAIRHGQDGDVAQMWYFLEKASVIWPGLLDRLDTFYELACGAQPRGHRGRASLEGADGSSDDMVAGLDDLFDRAGTLLEAMRGVAYGHAYLALAMLSDQAGRWGEARRYILRAVRANPRLLVSPHVLRRLVKLFVGKKLIGLMRPQRFAHESNLSENE